MRTASRLWGSRPRAFKIVGATCVVVVAFETVFGEKNGLATSKITVGIVTAKATMISEGRTGADAGYAHVGRHDDVRGARILTGIQTANLVVQSQPWAHRRFGLHRRLAAIPGNQSEGFDEMVAR
jgi:hypothetical protein